MTVSPSTQTKVSGSSFYAALRILPPRERAAMFAIYDFCRKVDDIADDPGPSVADRRAALDVWRADLDALYSGTIPESCADIAGPVLRMNGCNTSLTHFRLDRIAPPNTRPWPSMCLVQE